MSEALSGLGCYPSVGKQPGVTDFDVKVTSSHAGRKSKPQCGMDLEDEVFGKYIVILQIKLQIK
jgi:hypothetical protein